MRESENENDRVKEIESARKRKKKGGEGGEKSRMRRASERTSRETVDERETSRERASDRTRHRERERAEERAREGERGLRLEGPGLRVEVRGSRLESRGLGCEDLRDGRRVSRGHDCRSGGHPPNGEHAVERRPGWGGCAAERGREVLHGLVVARHLRVARQTAADRVSRA